MPAINNSFEIRMKGRWVTVPSLDIHGKTFYATGTWMRTARVRSEEMMEDELANPASYIEELKGSAKQTVKSRAFLRFLKGFLRPNQSIRIPLSGRVLQRSISLALISGGKVFRRKLAKT